MHFDTIIIGAGAAGMFCASHAAAWGAKVLVLDHAKKPGEKIRISGGGRCNFTNLHTSAENFISGNPHFAKSALKRYSQHDFMALVEEYNIPFHEKTLGQLFCDTAAKDIIDMLLTEMRNVGAELWLENTIEDIAKTESSFGVRVSSNIGWGGKVQALTCTNLVVACGGKSIPKMGATGFGYQIAEQFDLPINETRPALVPFTFGEDILTQTKPLAGVAVDAKVSTDGTTFDEAVLFTHRGISGPAILQISSYWREKQSVSLCLCPQIDLLAQLRARKAESGRQNMATIMADFLPKNLAKYVTDSATGNLADMSDAQLVTFCNTITNWQLHPIGTEGYRTAEVTLGGVDTDALSSKTMEAKTVPGLYFIGEVVDVTGWLGGYNFQWAWSSGWAAGTAIAAKN